MTTDVSIVRVSVETIRRTFWRVKSIQFSPKGYYDVKSDCRVQCPEEEAQLVSSLCTNGLHAPALDLDLPVTLVPSKTPGHFHLYIDHQMRWGKYKKLLKALKSAGLIDRGFYRICMRHHQSMLRMPGAIKGLYDDLVDEARALDYP